MAATLQLQKSPFQLFDSFLEKDNDKFFGRELETRILYQMIQETDIILVYGASGTGKTSLVQCGLVNRTKHFSWTSIIIRRLKNLNESLPARLKEHVNANVQNGAEELPPTELVREVYLNSFQPILLIFDQFEEVFVFGTLEERMAFYKTLHELRKLDVPCKFVFIIREEFLASVNELEKIYPKIFKKRLRILPMNRDDSRRMIIDTCRYFGIEMKGNGENKPPEKEGGFTKWELDIADKILEVVMEGKEMSLPYLQVFMDTLWNEANKEKKRSGIIINEALVEWAKSKGNVLKFFLDDRISKQDFVTKEDAWKVLKLFLSEDKLGIKKSAELENFTALAEDKMQEFVTWFKACGIIREVDTGLYELAHESLVPIIQQVRITELRTRLKDPVIEGNPYKGLESYTEDDVSIFYGRKEVVKTLLEKVLQLPLIVIVGNSGAGKSSLIKAGIFPALQAEEHKYKVLPVVRAGEKPLESINKALKEMTGSVDGKYILLIDQYEELVTRVNDAARRQEVYDRIFELIQKHGSGNAALLKIIITVRADFEPQFGVTKPLREYWAAGKYIVPPFTRDEICDIIAEPAYWAGLEFSPPSLVDTIADEVYSSQTTGLLPLMSFYLSKLYQKCIRDKEKDFLLYEEDYRKSGGVIGGLQATAEKVFHDFKDTHPEDYREYQEMMKNIILRMVYSSAGELAGQRVKKSDFEYKSPEENKRVAEILDKLLDSKLIVAGPTPKDIQYYEPAHDVLIKTWGQIWDWINASGKDTLTLQSRVRQAIDDYNNDDKDVQRLWSSDPWLNYLEKELQTENNWLNKNEAEFTEKSIRERERIKRNKTNKTRLAIIFLFSALVVIGFMAWQFFGQKEVAERSLDDAKAARIGSEFLNNELKKVLEVRNSVIEKNQALIKQVEAEKEAVIAQTKKKDSLNAILKREIRASIEKTMEIERQAQKLLEINSSNASLLTEQSFLIKNYKELLRSYESRTKQSTAQLLTIANNLRSTDIVKAYRVAEYAYKQDTSSTEAAAYFKSFADSSAYYYIRELKGNYSAFSPNGEYMLVSSTTSQMLKLIKATPPFQETDSIAIGSDLLSVDFSLDGKILLLTYPGRLELRRVNKLTDRNNFRMGGENISLAAISPNNDMIMLIDDGQIKLYNNFFNEKAIPKFTRPFRFNEKVAYAVFSEDSKTVLVSTVTGKAHVINATDGRTRPLDMKGDYSSYLSPKGNYFLVSTRNTISIFNSDGVIGSSLPQPDYSSNLDAVVFSQDDNWLCLSYRELPQKGNTSVDGASWLTLFSLMEGRRTPRSLSLVKNIGISGSFNSDRTLLIDTSWLIVGGRTGSIHMMNLYSPKASQMLYGHKSAITAISALRGRNYVLSSSGDNDTKIWQYSTPASLAHRNLLPELSLTDLRKLGYTP